MTSNSPNAAAAESAIRRIGTEFGRLRSLRGERLEDIATYLDIKATYLFGIEQGDLSVIPSKRDAKAMVRTYANYLGLDGEAIAGPMDPIIASLRGDKAPPEPVKTRRVDRTSVAILATAAVLGVLVGWTSIGDVEQFDLIAPPVTADAADAIEEEILEEPAAAGADIDTGGEIAEAVAEPAAATGGSRKQTWHFPSRAECMVCHSRAANFVLGLSTLQMNREHNYGGVTDNQLRVLERLEVFRVSWLD
ncbi:MAG: hypothetical protein HC861_09770, partial [Rhodospirillaceae bacterium]|nr:hypothetical protein [Rhodospirillaceae bacterium]